MNIFIVIVIFILIIFFWRRSKYSKNLSYQQRRLNTLSKEYISNNVKKYECNNDYILHHVNHFIFILNRYSFYPEARRKAPNLFFNNLFELGYITKTQLIEIKKIYYDMTVSLGRMINNS